MSLKDPGCPEFWQELAPEHRETCLKIRRQRMEGLSGDQFQAFREALEQLPLKSDYRIDLNRPSIKVGKDGEGACETLKPLLERFIPWKKGPFEIFGHHIDAEWRSDLKWQRLESYVGSLKGKRVCDIGCNNGYFMFRMAAHEPQFVLGLEPYAKHWFTFQLLNHYIRRPELYLELLGVEHMIHMPKSFDTVFCLGILYHHRDPISLLEGIRKSLRKKGRLFIDCQGIKGEEPVALIPGPRYAGARGIWYLPTLEGLKNWIRRAGYSQVEVIFQEKLSNQEQRTTSWAPIDSLRDFLDENDPEKTVEGYPAPYRFYIEARV